MMEILLGVKDIKGDIESLSGMIREGIIGNLTTYTIKKKF